MRDLWHTYLTLAWATAAGTCNLLAVYESDWRYLIGVAIVLPEILHRSSPAFIRSHR